MKILIVEHEGDKGQRIADLLRQEGCEVALASSCSEVLQRFARQKPDLVLMDVALSDDDGYRCTRKIAMMTNENFVPVMLTTSLTDHMTLERFLDSGAIDYLDEPWDPVVLRAKIASFARIRGLYQSMQKLQTRFDQEVRLARHMFDNMIKRSPAGTSAIGSWSVAAGHFSGDLLIHERRPDGAMQVLMADFTGHGLAAAVGALPTSEVFFAMTRKGLPIAEIAREINRKLNELLPTGHFCAATLVCLPPQADHIEAWIGGQPPLWLVDQKRQVSHSLPSNHFPLGVLADARFDATTQTLPISNAAHALLFSDGVIEAHNAEGEMFGEERLKAAIACPMYAPLLQRIKSRLIAFLDGLEPHDDASLLTLALAPID